MKTETKVDIADYLELYEFKKAYDEGRKINAYSELWESYWIPVDEMNDKMEARIREYERVSLNWQSEEEIQAEIARLNDENRIMKERIARQNDYVKDLDHSILTISKKLKSAQATSGYLRMALIASLLIIAILL